ncbi:MAG TPA: MBL fold metallo-hydrolase [Pyrinomonadaceae bacterium]|nr:MBL fold metallo-hydrolase [Chloracidobacterium sp.]MBP9936326.1 MBL fold metallo-hydrolase [Pyrinomonadaceae bacterium]MBK7802962.1 MBL fold metallo-hydrolase [Chloracidobacterium sp.]MBK9438386.1 MBL fold metallo-hydrolase [Chloracidobacterium sp.]MBK9767926.1 MBL fold metallo-hydrolase [Chloracidobacterium sp.]
MNLGDYRVEIIPDAEFKLDGGAMFGVVPRVVWERVCPADDLNRIRLNMNCLFIETPNERILIETGIGEKWTDRETAMYGIDRKRPFADSLATITGYRPDDITIVVNTHLHFDHAGGNTIGTKLDGFRPQFPNARYLLSRSEFEHAEHPHERDRASYLSENWRPMQESGQLELMPDSYEVVEGLRLEQIRGHSETMQTVRLDRGGRTLYGFADLIPTRHHLPLAWIAGFDLYPVGTLEFKKKILPQAVRENWLCLFYHDTQEPLCTLTEINGKIAVRKSTLGANI